MRVGIIGAGTMGTGIAQAFVGHEDFSVVLCDISKELAEGAKARIAAQLERLAAKGKLDKEQKDNMLSRIEPGVLEDVADCGLVIEAAIEDMEAKKACFIKLSEICKNEDVLLATNTSSLSITELSAAVGRPIIGMHFFNPAPVMKLVEIVAGLTTPPEQIGQVKAIADKIGKVPVQVEESAGFVVNRILIPMINEAVGIYAEGLASAEDIDTAIKLGANHPLGPLALGDLVGLDVCLAIMEVLHAELGEDKYRPHPLMRKMVRAGLLGRKTGKGFFVYSK